MVKHSWDRSFIGDVTERPMLMQLSFWLVIVSDEGRSHIKVHSNIPLFHAPMSQLDPATLIQDDFSEFLAKPVSPSMLMFHDLI